MYYMTAPALASTCVSTTVCGDKIVSLMPVRLFIKLWIILHIFFYCISLGGFVKYLYLYHLSISMSIYIYVYI